MQPKAPKTSTKTHRRSRTGCFTCRLRRKKCDEGKPVCKACRHLGLQCEYKRPTWWANVDQRKRQKESIKILIKRTKLSEKVNQISPPLSADSPPELSRSSVTTSDSSCTSENLLMHGRRRSLSIDSGYSLEYEFEDGFVHGAMGDVPFGGQDLSAFQYYQQPFNPFGSHPFAPFDVAAFPETKEMTGFGFPPRKASASFPGMIRRHSASGGMLSVVPQDTTFAPVDNIQLTPPSTSTVNSEGEAIDFNFFDFSFPREQATPCSNTSDYYSSAVTTQAPYIPVDDSDRFLLDHFLENVVRSIFPVLDHFLNGQTRQEIILPSLATNKSYMHCCLSIAAQHLKATQNISPEFIDQDIMRHRYATISSLCEALKEDAHHLEILEATLAMILFQCTVGSSSSSAPSSVDDSSASASLPDIPWHSHFQAAISLVQKLDLTNALNEISNYPAAAMPTNPIQYTPRPFNMSLTAWIDILGATMLGRAPVFADTYREKHLANGRSGLQELMGCDDQVMYLISEIACLEALKVDGILSDMDLCEHVKSLAAKIDLTEDMAAASIPHVAAPPVVISHGTSIDRVALCYHLTAAFRYAARIYLCSLVPGFNKNQIQVKELLNKLVATLEQIPGGIDGFDGSLAWVYLVAGSVATEGSLFRRLMESRGEMLASAEYECSNWGKMMKVVSEVWRMEDLGMGMGMGISIAGVAHEVSYMSKWRDVMKVNGWEWLLL